jgi:hypothetical protein
MIIRLGDSQAVLLQEEVREEHCRIRTVVVGDGARLTNEAIPEEIFDRQRLECSPHALRASLAGGDLERSGFQPVLVEHVLEQESSLAFGPRGGGQRLSRLVPENRGFRALLRSQRTARAP